MKCYDIHIQTFQVKSKLVVTKILINDLGKFFIGGWKSEGREATGRRRRTRRWWSSTSFFEKLRKGLGFFLNNLFSFEIWLKGVFVKKFLKSWKKKTTRNNKQKAVVNETTILQKLDKTFQNRQIRRRRN